MRVLLAEDDQRITNFIARGLRENAYAVDTAENGSGAVGLSIGKWIAEAHDGQLILLDSNKNETIFQINLPVKQNNV